MGDSQPGQFFEIILVLTILYRRGGFFPELGSELLRSLRRLSLWKCCYGLYQGGRHLYLTTGSSPAANTSCQLRHQNKREMSTSAPAQKNSCSLRNQNKATAHCKKKYKNCRHKMEIK
uniref:(northern house mosquito) hypothetical protein n=1 Tax=Culex pipiens TaxID=7175 RepID=A0A8D8FPD1_CULPI